MVKRSEKGVVSRLIRQTSCLFIEIPPRALKTEFKCHLRLSNGRRAGGDHSKRLGDKRPLLNMARAAGNVPGPARAPESASRWRALERPELPRPPGEPGMGGGGPGPRLRGRRGVGVGTEGGGRCKTTYLPPPSPETRRERLVRFPLTSFLSVAQWRLQV